MKRERVVLLSCLLLPVVVLTLTFMMTPWNNNGNGTGDDKQQQQVIKDLDMKVAKQQKVIEELSSQVSMNIKHRDQLHERVKQLESSGGGGSVVVPVVASVKAAAGVAKQLDEMAQIKAAKEAAAQKRELDALRAEAKDLVVDGVTQGAIDSCKRLVEFKERDISRCPQTDPYGKSCRTAESEAAVTSKKCLIYSVGIADWYEFDKWYGSRGCEVHSFDPTVTYDKDLAPGVTFHHIGMRGSKQTSLSDEALKNGKEFLVSINVEKMGKVTGKMMTLQEIRKMLGHEDRELTVLKLDCEGCEWGVIEDLAEEVKASGKESYALNLAIEWHFQKGIGIDKVDDVLRIAPVEEFITKHYLGPASYFQTGTHPRDAKVVDELKLCLPRKNYIAEIAYVRK